MSPEPDLAIVKVGGSLASDPPALREILARIADGSEGRAAIVPGGGPFADAVRASQRRLGYSDGLAHGLALTAMGMMARVLAELEPRLTVIGDIDGIGPALASGEVPVWDPVALRAGQSEIGESWDVTSDSLALWLAGRLGASRCILVKSAPCPAQADLEDLARSGYVDRAFPHFARGFSGTIAFRGPDEAGARAA